MHNRMDGVLHHSHAVTHCIYLAAVSIEGHGTYATAAALLLVVSIVMFTREAWQDVHNHAGKHSSAPDKQHLSIKEG